MKRERAKELLPIIQAYAEGKKIQFLSRQQQLNGKWIYAAKGLNARYLVKEQRRHNFHDN